MGAGCRIHQDWTRRGACKFLLKCRTTLTVRAHRFVPPCTPHLSDKGPSTAALLNRQKTRKQTTMPDEQSDPRTYFAAERTFLAWIRTGLGLMGVGFAVARFGLFLREMRATQLHAPLHSPGVSVYSGVALVALGVAVNVTAVLHHVRTVRALRTGTWTAGRVAQPAVILALLLAVVGVGMGVYLLFLQ